MIISVVTCTYNAAAVLTPTLRSVASQSNCEVEHLIIDGKSKDSTMAMVEEYKAMAPSHIKVRAVSEPDDGLYYAMNKALGMVTGDYVIFLNAGDRFKDSTTLAKVSKEAGLAGVVYGQTDIVDIDDNVLRHRHKMAPKVLTWRSFADGMLVCHQAFYVRRDIAASMLYDTNYRFSADVDWCIRVMKECERQAAPLVYVDDVLAHFLDGGLTNKNHKASLKERFTVMRKHYGLWTTILKHIKFCF